MKQSLKWIALAITTTGALAQTNNKFTLEGEFRPRTEWRDGFNTGNANNPNVTTSGNHGVKGYVHTDARAAIAATYATDTYTSYIKLQEVFNYGDRYQTDIKGNGNFRVQEAWAELKLNSNINLKIGRQGLGYDDERILGNLDWAQQARTHDVAMFKYKKETYALDLGYGLNQGTVAGNAGVYDLSKFFSYKQIAFAHANKKFKNLNLSALILNTKFQDKVVLLNENISDLLTAGIHFDTKLAGINLSGNSYIQNGKRFNGPSGSVVGDVTVDKAFLLSLDAKYNATEKTAFLVGTEIISGKTNQSAAFFPLYGTNHKFNGVMDKFYVGNYANAGGLVDANAGINAKLWNTYDFSAMYHHFTEQQDLDKKGSNLGDEIDLNIAKNFKGYSVKGGYSQFFDNGLSSNEKNIQNWAYVMLIIKPKFL